MSIFDTIRDHKSRNDLEGAWQAGFAVLELEPGNEFLKTSLFWVIYLAVKSLVEPVKSRENKVPLPYEQARINLWASRIPALQLSLPSENIDFRLWKLFDETLKFCEPLCLYILQSGSRLFTPDDHKPYVTEKGESPSMVMRLARRVAAGFLVKGPDGSLPPSRVIAFLKYAQTHAKDSTERKLWLEWDKARVYFAIGELARARKAYLAVLKKKRQEPWAWFGLAKTYASEPDKAICLIASGLTVARDPKFSVTGLVELTKLLAQTGAYEQASKALVTLMRIYKQNNWPPKDSIVKLASYAWYDAAVDTRGFDTAVKTLAENATLYCLSKPCYYQGIVQSIHASNKGANIYISRDLVMPVRRAVFPEQTLPAPGSFVKVLCDSDAVEKDIVCIEIIQAFNAPDIRAFDGPLTISEKGFGFVNKEIFVPATLIAGLEHDTQVVGIAVMSFDKLKNRYGWKAITTTCQESDLKLPAQAAGSKVLTPACISQ